MSPSELLAVIRQRYSYDKQTGALVWREEAKPRRAGRAAGGVDSRGYTQISINGTLYLAHRLVWMLHHGEVIPEVIDHINGIRRDNRIENLRAADSFINAQNTRAARVSNKHSGMQGVSRITRSNKWQARILAYGVRHHLGSFDTPEQAHAAYLDAKKRLHPIAVTGVNSK